MKKKKRLEEFLKIMNSQPPEIMIENPQVKNPLQTYKISLTTI